MMTVTQTIQSSRSDEEPVCVRWYQGDNPLTAASAMLDALAQESDWFEVLSVTVTTGVAARGI